MSTIIFSAKEYYSVMRCTDIRPDGVKPCPFCGESKEIWAMKYDHDAGSRYCVMCFGCMTTVDVGYSPDVMSALRHWNRRDGKEDQA